MWIVLWLLGGCHLVSPGGPGGPIEPFATVEPLDGGGVFLEVDALAYRDAGAVMRVNDLPWASEGVARRGDRIEIGYQIPPRAGRLAYRVLGRTPEGRIYFEASRWFDDGFPARSARVSVWPYRDLVWMARSR